MEKIPEILNPAGTRRSNAHKEGAVKTTLTLKLPIIRLVEQSHLPAKTALALLGIPKTTFYRWYDRYQGFGEAGLEDR